MNIAYFTHSIQSDWNNGNVHFMRGVATELIKKGHTIEFYEPDNNWSSKNLRKYYGEKPFIKFHGNYPHIQSFMYNPDKINLDTVTENKDVVIVHEWNDTPLVKNIGIHHRKRKKYTLLFHDTHHRAVTDPEFMMKNEIKNYDGVLAFGDSLKKKYLQNRWTERAWVWHEAADINVFKPIENRKEKSIIWIGNWGDGERSAELYNYLIMSAHELKLTCTMYGVRYPASALDILQKYGINYGGYISNCDVPYAFGKHILTVHIQRNPYLEALKGIPTIRVFEALACGIPLLCYDWDDYEQLFTKEQDYLTFNNPDDLKRKISLLMNEPGYARQLAENGIRTIRERHTCKHRTDQLIGIIDECKNG
jgi:spore maturation protein CgeB